MKYFTKIFIAIVFFLRSLINCWSVDEISTITAPTSVFNGSIVPVTVSYVATTDRALLIIFQRNSAPWTEYGSKTISVTAGSSTLEIPLAINADTPVVANAYKFSVSLLPSAEAIWDNRLDEIIHSNVSCIQPPQLFPDMFTVYPTEYHGALRNPLKGFRPDTFRNNYDDEYATITRCYLKWNELENDESDTIEKIMDVCNQKWAGVEQHGIKVIPRVYLDWDEQSGNEYWPADMTTGDYSSEQFKQRLVRLISRLGECWDNDPRVAWVQMGFIGLWGEHYSPVTDAEIQELMGDAFTQAFQNKKFLVRHANEFTDYDVGVYWDSWAHIQQIFEMQHGAGIEALNISTDRWKVQPIEGETAYNWGESYIQPGSSPDDTLSDPEHREFLIDTIRNLHCSGLGWIADYNQYDPEARAGAEEVQKAFGYRFVIPHFSWGQKADADGSIRLVFSVINTGSAPFYEDWPLEFSLLDIESGDLVWKTVLEDVDIRQWLPGDDWDEESNVYLDPPDIYTVDVNITLPGLSLLPAGEYIVALAILEPVGKTPSVRFAVNNYLNSGRHPFGKVGIGTDTPINYALDGSTFVDPMRGDRLSYLLQAADIPEPAILEDISAADGICRIMVKNSAEEAINVVQRSKDLVEWEAIKVTQGTGIDIELLEPISEESELFFKVLTYN